MDDRAVMVIDDSASVRQLVSIALRGAGWGVVECADGLDALARLDEKPLRLVLCDVNMPRLDGLGFLEKLREHPRHRFTPVIMLTTETEAGRKSRAQQAGAKAWITKPFQPDQLLSAVKRLARP